MLARPEHIDAPATCCRRALAGRFGTGAAGSGHSVADFIAFHRYAATFPWQCHALWLYAQMVRWGQVAHSAEAAVLARTTFRPDLYRAALSGSDVPIPLADTRSIGAVSASLDVATTNGTLALPSDRPFDGATFDPDQLDAYLSASDAEGLSA